MAENPNAQQQADAANPADATPAPEEATEPKRLRKPPPGSEDNDLQVPKWRLDLEAKERQELEKQVRSYQEAEEKREQERAEKTGEYQTVLKKKDDKIKGLQERIKALEAEKVRDARFRVWSQAANGIVRGDALADAFKYVEEDEWQATNEEDENAVRVLAQTLVERKPFFADTGIVGAGSGGSSRPLVAGDRRGGARGNGGIQQGTTSTLSTGRTVFNLNKKQRHW